MGEVPGAPRPHAPRVVPPGSDGRHWHGTEEEWYNGAHYDPLADYDTMCRGPGGQAHGGFSPSYPSTSALGGQAHGGRSAAFSRGYIIASGGQAHGGLSTAFSRGYATATGGQAHGGLAGIAGYDTFDASGGQAHGGISPVQGQDTFTASGGQSHGGLATVAGRAEVTASGGQAQGGLAFGFAAVRVIAQGGQAQGALAAGLPGEAFTASGGQAHGGLSPADSGQPTPGTSCATAASVNQSQTYSYTRSMGPVDQWFTFTVPSAGTWHIATTGFGGFGAASPVFFTGASCSPPGPMPFTTFGPPRWVFTGTAGQIVRMSVSSPLSGSTAYTFVWDSGP